MLENIGTNIIEASYEALHTKLGEIEGLISEFEQEKSETNINALRTSVADAHLLWQTCSPFEFGPAAEQNLRLSVNTFPLDTARVNENITNGNTSIDGTQDAASKGFPAMVYLLFRDDASAILTEMQDANNWAYFKANFDLVQTKTNAVYDAWQNGYSNDFKGNTSSNVGGSISLLVNQLNFDFELLKNAKIGIPLGKKTLGVTQVDKIESPFAKQSIALAVENLNSIENAFKGASGSGLDDYLDALGAKYNQNDLSDEILSGFAESRTALEAIDNDLATAIDSETSKVETAHTALQNLVVLLKVDMPSQLGVQITYQDNDGD
jgi:predicted lipoprotein